MEIEEEILGPNHPDVAQSLNNIALIYKIQGQYTEVEPLYKRAISIWIKSLGPDHPRVATGLNNLATFYKTQGRYQDAELIFKQALSIREKSLGPEHPDVAASLNNLGLLYKMQGRYSEAELLYKRSLSIWEKSKGSDHPDLASGLNNLASLYQTQGRYTEAEPLFQRALAIKEKSMGPDHPEVAECLNNLALLYKTQDRYPEAEALYKRSLSIWEKSLGPDHPAVASSLNNLAILYEAQGRGAETEPFYKKAVSISERALGPDHPDVALHLQNLAEFYDTQGRYADAEPLYKRSLTIWVNSMGPDHPDVALNLNNLGVLYGVMGQYQNALNLMIRGLAIDEKVIDNVFMSASERVRLAFLSTLKYRQDILLSLVFQGLQNDPEALRSCFDATLKRKGLVLESLAAERKSLLFSDNPQAQDLFNQDHILSTQLANLMLSGPENEAPTVFREKIEDLEKSMEEIESRLARMSQAYAQEKASEKADCRTIAQQLPSDAVFIEMMLYEEYNFKANPNEKKWGGGHYLAFILKKNENPVPILVDLAEASRMNDAVRHFRQEMSASSKNMSQWGESRAEGAIRERGRELYQLVFAPLIRYLGGIKTIYFAPDGDLNLIPFGLLEDENGNYLMEQYQIHILSSGRDLMNSKEKYHNSAKIVIMADPDFNASSQKRQAAIKQDSDEQLGLAMRGSRRMSADLRNVVFGPLPETGKEAEQIEQLFPGGDIERYLGQNAMEEFFKGLQAPRILHIATHGFFLEDQSKRDIYNEMYKQRGLKIIGDPAQVFGPQSENPLLRSGLAFAGANRVGKEELPEGVDDGILTALEISGKNFMGTDLVVLSACETGLGETMPGEGVFGLRRAFQLAGAKSVVMSLWKVPDEETRELMVEFYKWIQAGEGNSSALQRAQLEMMKKRKKETGAAHPFFWGAFVCVGD